MKMSIVENGTTTKEYGIALEEIAPILESEKQCCHLFFRGDGKNVMVTMSINEFYDLRLAVNAMDYNIERYVFGNNKNTLDKEEGLE